MNFKIRATPVFHGFFLSRSFSYIISKGIPYLIVQDQDNLQKSCDYLNCKKVKKKIYLKRTGASVNWYLAIC